MSKLEKYRTKNDPKRWVSVESARTYAQFYLAHNPLEAVRQFIVENDHLHTIKHVTVNVDGEDIEYEIAKEVSISLKRVPQGENDE